MNKKVIFAALISLLYCGILQAQFSYVNLLDKKKYSKIQKKIEKLYLKDPNNISVNYDFSVLYSIREYKLFNIDSAFIFAKRAEKFYSISENKEKLNKNMINEQTLQEQILLICKMAYDRSINENTIEGYNNFYRNFPDNKQLVEEALKKRNNLAFEFAKKINTVESFQDFINTYPNAIEIEQAKKMRNAIAFQYAKEKNTIESFQKFINNYPFSDEVEQAVDLRDQLSFNQASLIKTSQAFNLFLLKYPDSKLYSKANYEKDKLLYFETIINNNVLSHIYYLKNNPDSKYKEEITDTLYYLSKRQENLQGFQYLIENYDYTNLSDSIWYYYYKIFTSDGYPITYETFRGLYKDVFPYENLLQEDYEHALLFDDLKLEDGYNKNLEEKYKEFIRLSPDKYISFNILQIILKPYLLKKKWKEALLIINDYKLYFGTSNKYVNNLIDILTYSDRNIISKNIGTSINTTNGGEYVPVISANNQYLFFCGSERNDNYSGEDIFVSENRNGIWQLPTLLEDLCTFGNDAPLSISTDGNRLLLFKNGDLYYSDQTLYGWSEIEEFPSPINSDEWDADAMISSDGNAIIFTSRRKDVNEGSGVDLLPLTNTDIYVCIKTNDDQWSYPINLGEKINTRFTERTPYLHSDMKTLYFSSNGHGGLGDNDVFKVTRLNDSSWTEWSDPINMGKEINTTDNDWGYKISTDGELAYYSGIYHDKNDIYTVNLPLYLRPGYVATISGKLKDKNNQPVESTIKWEDLETGKMVGESKSNPKDGSFFIVLPLGKVYGYFIDKNEYYPISNNIDLRSKTEPVEVENNIEMITFKQMIDEGVAVPINNLFFPINKDKLLPESIPELKRVAEIIKANKLKVEISGHTDNTGSNEYNQELSEKRAKAVSDYLISLDIPSDLITIIGYGSTKPIANNDTEEGKSKNRRVELKFK